MKKLFLISLILLIFSSLYCQNADSLYGIYLNKKQEVQPTLLLELAKAYQDDSIEMSIGFAHEALTLASATKAENAIAQSSNMLAVFYKENTEYDTAKVYANIAIDLYVKLKEDKELYEAINTLSLIYFSENNLDSSLYFLNKVIDYSIEIEDYNWQVNLYKVKARMHFLASDFDNVENTLKKELSILEITKDSVEIALAFNSLSTNSRKLGKYQQAVEYSKESLNIYESLQDSAGVAECYASLGSIHYYMDENDQAVKYFIKSFKIFNKLGNFERVAGMSNNIGSVYVEMEEYRKSLKYYTIALEGFADMDNKYAEAIISDNLGLSHSGLGEYNRAEEYFARSLKVQQEIGNKEGVVHALSNIAGLHFKKGNPRKAHGEYKLALQKAIEHKLINNQMYIYKELVDIEEKLGLYKDALRSNRNYIAIKDTLFSRESKSQLNEMQTQLELQEQQARYDLLSSENELNKAKMARQKLFTIAVVLVSVLILLLLLIVLFALRYSRTAKAKLEEKNAQIVYHNNRMTDSIKYARRVQRALIKSSGNLSDYYKNNFIISKAQSIVSGDFFWFKNIDNKLYLITADCTGHGVPGAFMSVLGLTLVNEVLKENSYIPANKILDKLRDNIKEALNQIDLDSNSDGMDVTICILDTETNNMEFAGAYNSVYIVRSSELIEFKGDRMSVSIARKEHPFSKQELNLQKGDRMYLFTDGYIDQLKKESGEKISSKRLKKMLVDQNSLPINRQGKELLDFFENWKADNEQTDDMLLVGIEI